jgi:hypothetical protein
MTTPHLDDEALSAALDDEATADEQAHLPTCSICRAKLASLSAVAQAVGAPVTPPPAAAVDDAIARALVSLVAPEVGAGGRVGAGRRGGTGGRVVSGGRSAPWEPAALHRGRPKPPKWLAPVAGIAAAFVIFGGAVALLDRPTHTSSTATLAPAQTNTGRATAGLSSPSIPTVTLSGDLGNQSDPAVVAQRLAAALQVPAQIAGSPADSARGTGSGTAPGTTNSFAAPVAPKLAATPCVAEGRAAVGLAGDESGVVSYSATLRWRGEAAVTVAFSRIGRLSGVIMRTADCSVLVVLPF